MENLLRRQQDIVEAIKNLERNFNKDSASRKTRKYLDERLDNLDKLWAEFNVNNRKLLDYENESEPYFVEEQYQQARTYFDSVRSKISSFHPAIETSAPTQTVPKTLTPGPSFLQAPPKPQPRPLTPSTSQVPMTHPTEVGQVPELLSLQRTNFRAFYRQLTSIKVDEIRDKWELEDELRNIQIRWNAIDALHLQIDNILQGSDTQYEDEFYSYENSYKAMKKALNLKLASNMHLQQSTPQIDIPTFSGNYTQWPTFYDLYVESIHNNNLLTTTQKMQHLKGKLRGEADRLIQHLHISADNYETAWKLLTHRYNHPQLLFTKQIENFINQPVVHKQSAYEIRRLYDTSMESIHAIQNLGIDTSTWDPLLVHLIAKKLDAETCSQYKEARKSPRDLPSLSELMAFLESKFNALEPITRKDREIAASSDKPYPQRTTNNKSLKPNFQQVDSHRFRKFSNREYQAIATCSVNCPICNNNHNMYKCKKFLKMTPDERLLAVIKLNRCQNCLYTHNDSPCKSAKTCKVCQNSHNTLLHDAYANINLMPQSTDRSTDTVRSSPESTALVTQRFQIPTQRDNKQHNVNHVASDDEEILLTTLSIRVKAIDGTYVTLRALLDQGSQISLISENAAQMLGCPRKRYHASVSGIGNGSKQGKGVVILECQSIYEDFEFTTQALVIKNVINNLPNMSFSKQSWQHIQHIQLADPEYNVSRPIDLLLDASIYSEIIMNGLIKGPHMAPIAQQTRLGWVLSGNVKTFKCHVVLNDLTEIAQYWEIEDISNSTPQLTQDEERCEQYYRSTTRRLATGRYEVAIPMKSGFEQHLGQSKSKAIAQFHNLENKMLKDELFADSYRQFLREYEQQGHMYPVTQNNEPSCYLPHHSVLKTDSTTTKLRTVFKASSKTTTGYSFNDLMDRGPNLQKDLQHLILVWRQHRYVITADIEKMFRQIIIREPDQHLQCIVWRSTPGEPLKLYQLATVTYGTKAAPYLAMRTLKQLAMDDAHKFPLAAIALMTSFHMDDLMEGCNELIQCKQLQREIIDILKGAGMNIRKWSSNAPELIQNLSAEQLDMPLDFKCPENRKTLGLRWNPTSDNVTFKNVFKDETSDSAIKTTKRQLLAHISKIFDPLGWLSPLTIRAKLLFQRFTWSEETVDWDTSLPDDVNNEWIQLRRDFQNIENFNIPRYLGEKSKYIVHVFCDASEKAYAYAIYVTTQNCKGEFTLTLVIAKTKLAPLKNKLTLPKLELCGALLLSQLMKKVRETLSEDVPVYAWTDSMIVLGWLHGDILRWKQFVANRVRTILNIIPSSSWHHVRSEENAADCATRGLTSQQLSDHLLWWRGPQWLSTFDLSMIKDNTYEPPKLETKKTCVSAAVSHKNDLIIRLLYECSSTRRITTTIGWLTRFSQWLQNKQIKRQSYLSTSELQHALNLIINSVQSIEFEDAIQQLQQNGKLKTSSKLLSLNSSDGRLTELIIHQAHTATLHGGPSFTLSNIRDKYWIISGLRTVKRELRKCVTCRRFEEEKRTQIMADLPEPRVTPSHPFTHTGVNFERRSRRNNQRSLRTIISTAMMLFMLLLTPAQCSYNISTFNDSQNLYFDKMYDVNLIRDEWKLIVYYNMSTYWTSIRHVQNYIGHLEKYLHTTELPIQYRSIIYQLQHELSEIEHYNRILKSQSHKRQKRGLIDGVGYVANSLFGVLDDRFAKKYEKDIEKISLNEKHLQLLIKNQTSVIEAQYNILQRNEAIMNKQFGIVQKYLENMTLSYNQLQLVTNEELHILSSSLSAMIIISNIRNMQENVIRTVTDLARGHMDAHLLPPEQLEEQLNIVYSHIPNDLTLSADKHDFREIYKLMKIRGDIGPCYLIIEVKIPLVDKDVFELDQVISLPLQSYIVEFIAPYIAFNLQKDLLLTLTETDVQNCIHTQTNSLLCSIDKPIYELKITQSICNLNIHNKTMCNAKKELCRERWIKLHHDNRWLFSCCGKCAVRIFCTDTGMIMKSFTGNGLLEIGQGCTIKTEFFSILGHNSYLSHSKIQGDIPMLSETSILNSIFNASDFAQFIPEDHEDEWLRIKTQITNLKEQENAPLSIHDVHQYSVLYTILSLILVTGCIYLVIRWRRHKGTLNMATASSPTVSIPMTTITSGDQERITPPTTRPRSVRLDIPVTSVVQ